MRTVLVIEDEQLVVELSIELLNSWGFNAINAIDSYMGVLLAKEFAPDLVLCKVSSKHNNYSAIRELRFHPLTAKIPLIFLATKGTQLDNACSEQLGINHCLIKPFSSEELLQAVINCGLKLKTHLLQ